jgi:MoaA/NifB/PqqE/SkfB family radical SAM enzyme
MTPLEKAKSSKTFCILPWLHQYVGPPGDVKPCCLYEQDMQIGDLKQNTLKEIWNNDATKQMRLDMLNGVELVGCAKCNSRANLTTTHKDQFNKFLFNNDFAQNFDLVESTQTDGSIAEHQLQYIDARFNNLCNLKCRTCGPRFSTSWIEDHVKLYNVPKEDRAMHSDIFQFPGSVEHQLLDEIIPQLPHVRQIYFAGGEPLMQKEHYAVLEELIRLGKNTRPDFNLHYNTNFSILNLGKKDAIELWKQFKRLRVNASIDGSHARAEYWRKGTVWSQLVSNVQRFRTEVPQGEFCISYTLSWVSAFNLPELHREWVDLKLISVNDVYVNLLDVPSHYSLKSIPNWKKDKIKEKFEAHIQWMIDSKATEHAVSGFKNAITFMCSVDHGDSFADGKAFNELNGRIDQLREEDFWTTYPEHADMKIFIDAA